MLGDVRAPGATPRGRWLSLADGACRCGRGLRTTRSPNSQRSRARLWPSGATGSPSEVVRACWTRRGRRARTITDEQVEKIVMTTLESTSKNVPAYS